MAESVDTYSDIEEGEEDVLTEVFNKATDRVKTLASNLEPSKLLELYSFYKQALEGPCNIPRPRWYEMQAKSKWDAWNSLGSMHQSEAKQMYIRIVSELDPNFEKSEKTGWVTVSCLAKTEDTVEDSDKTAFDYVKESDLTNLVEHLKNSSRLLNEVDDDGLGLIHWAADRGNLDVLKYILQLNVDVNLTDNDGQTALHYAVSCEHVDCIQLLVDMGVNVNAKDNCGMSAKDFTSNSCILELFKDKS